MVGAKLRQTPRSTYIRYWHHTTLQLFKYLYYERIWGTTTWGTSNNTRWRQTIYQRWGMVILYLTYIIVCILRIWIFGALSKNYWIWYISQLFFIYILANATLLTLILILILRLLTAIEFQTSQNKLLNQSQLLCNQEDVCTYIQLPPRERVRRLYEQIRKFSHRG